MKDVPKYNSAQLSLSLYEKWEVALEGYERKLRGAGLSELHREKNKIIFAFQGIESIMGFRDTTEKRAVQDLFVYFPNQGGIVNSSRRVMTEARKRFELHDESIYKRIFGKEEPNVSTGDINYGRVEYKGALFIITPVFEIPLGGHQGLSDNLFSYFRRGIYGPVHELIKSKKST